MAEPRFAKLLEVPLREAWRHEAHRFTPWLAENLDRLQSAVGIPLELTGTEVRVGSFSADILARNSIDDSVVLIENQLEPSDHTHLGQIMTYLAGLETHTMIWVAPSFREEHLSAIRWLNEHTASPFAFFAVRVSVVRIEDSPLAPLFEVIERPNEWDRQVAQAKKDDGQFTALGQFRLEFWTRYAELFPGEVSPGGASSQWLELPGTLGVVVQYISKKGVGVFVRPANGVQEVDLRTELEPHASALEACLGSPLGDGRYMFGQDRPADMNERTNWDDACHWLYETANDYVRSFSKIFA